MNPNGVRLHAHATRIAEWTAGQHDLAHIEPVIEQLVRRLGDCMEHGETLDASILLEQGLDEVLVAKALRSVYFESIETFRKELRGAEFHEAVLALRACVRPAIPHCAVALENAAFYQPLVRGNTAEAPLDQARLVQFFEDIVTTLQDIVYVHDLNGTMLYVNKPGLRLTRYTAEDLREGLSVYDFIVPEYTDLIEARLESPGAVSRAPYASEIYTKDGERIPFEISTRCLKQDGHVIGVVGMARDLRLARRLEGEIRKSNAYVEQIVALAPIGIVLTDSQSVVIDANPAAVRIFGAPDAVALAGHAYPALFEGDDRPLRDFLLRALAQDSEVRTTHAQVTKFGAALHCELTVTPMRQESGCVDSLLILMADITNQVTLQQNLVQSEKLSAIGEIVAGVAHELNNPLTGILGYAQLLLTAQVDGSVHDRLAHIATEADRCRRIVQNLLSFARHYESEKELHNLNDVLTEVLNLREYQLRIDGIELELDLARDLPNAYCDAHEIQRVFLNITNNAQQALAAIEGRAKRLAISTRVEGPWLKVAFADNGPGIPRAIQTKVFDPFFTTKGVGEGTGLGLSVSYGIVRDHGGQITLESTEGGGATFTILLPTATAESLASS